MTDETLWMAIRQALLMIVDAIERRYDKPRTAQLRKLAKSETDTYTLPFD